MIKLLIINLFKMIKTISKFFLKNDKINNKLNNPEWSEYCPYIEKLLEEQKKLVKEQINNK